MEKFYDYLKEKAWMLACKTLDSAANSFGFARQVPDIVQEIENRQLGEEAYTFFAAFVTATAQRYPDGRCEKSVGIAKQIIEAGMLDMDGTENAVREVGVKVIGGSMHPTVMQQAAQLAFYFLDTAGAVPAELKEDNYWWRMPLI